MSAGQQRSLVDPNKPTESNWLRHNPEIVGFGNIGTPRSSVGTAGTLRSSIFDNNRATGSSVSTIDSQRDANGIAASNSRWSTLTIDHAVPSPKTRSALDQIVQFNIHQTNQVVKDGKGVSVQFILDLEGESVREYGLNVKVQGQHSDTANARIAPKLPEPVSTNQSLQPQDEVDQALPQHQEAEEVAMNCTAPHIRDTGSPRNPILKNSFRKHKSKLENQSVTTIQSRTSAEERKRRLVGEDILVTIDKTNKEVVFARLDTQSTRSWISREALKDLLSASSDVVEEERNVMQTIDDEQAETWTVAGLVKPFGKIKLSYRCCEGPSSGRWYRAWFYVIANPKIPVQVILRQDFPGLKDDIGNCSFVTLTHPKSQAQKTEDAARKKKSQERKQNIAAQKAHKDGSHGGTSHSGHQSKRSSTNSTESGSRNVSEGSR